ncbi:MAG: hypothetical protein ABJN34_05590 [Litoreibacter sp.]|uniref:hypothetical protein n=1 Tax=Litoreibacter sp. TaxID=1969459 RepID=UPI00329868CF
MQETLTKNMCPPIHPQVSFWNPIGHIALCDDTAVKNRYRVPIGVLAVIDNDYWTRIVGQSITADPMVDPFVLLLGCALDSRWGKRPEVHIQDVDAAMAGEVRQVFLDVLTRQYLWRFYRNIIKSVAKDLGRRIIVHIGA